MCLSIQETIKFAKESHRGQMYGDRPYEYHLESVAEVVKTFSFDGRDTEFYDIIVKVAWLHDIVEDTSVTLDMLRTMGYSEAVVNGVEAMNRDEKESYGEYINRVMQSEVALYVKLADSLCNFRESKKNNDTRRMAKYAMNIEKLIQVDFFKPF